MICKCQNCDAALVYQPSLRMMECTTCGSYFSLEEVSVSEVEAQKMAEDSHVTLMQGRKPYGEKAEQHVLEKEKQFLSDKEDEMECNVYTCTSCGAQLLVNGVESSTFCAYCGQPTVVFERVSKEKKPDYIIPFQIMKEQAIAAIRQRLQKGKFIPKEIQNFEPERIKGIYVPFWSFDMNYQDKQYIKGTVGFDTKKTKYFYREATASFRHITVDASAQLSDESSQRLEPFDLSVKKPFDAGYLSGFYADVYDEERSESEKTAKIRAQQMYDHEVKYSVDAHDLTILSSAPLVTTTVSDYIMLPVWFMTFRYQDEPYTILVNGQTGKVIGAVPFFKKKVITKIIVLTAVFAPLFSVLFFGFIFLIYLSVGHIFVPHWLLPIVAGAIMGGIASVFYKKVSASIRLTKATSMNTFVKNRQEV